MQVMSPPGSANTSRSNISPQLQQAIDGAFGSTDEMLVRVRFLYMRVYWAFDGPNVTFIHSCRTQHAWFQRNHRPWYEERGRPCGRLNACAGWIPVPRRTHQSTNGIDQSRRQ
jgi:hypothetical protein